MNMDVLSNTESNQKQTCPFCFDAKTSLSWLSLVPKLLFLSFPITFAFHAAEAF